MKQQTRLITFDRECRQFLISLKEQLTAPHPLPLIVNGLSAGAADALCTEAMSVKSGGPFLYVVPGETEAHGLRATLAAAGKRAVYYPGRDFVYDFVSASHGMERERLFVLSKCLLGEVDAVVTTGTAALQLTIPPDLLREKLIRIAPGDTFDPVALASRLSEMGYTAVETVESAGQFTRRGGILDVWSRGDAPVRIEFFDIEVDRMGYFDPESQRVTDECDAVTLLPAREVELRPETAGKLLTHLRQAQKKATSEDAKSVLRSEIAALEGGTDLLDRDKYISLLYPEKRCLLDYFEGSPHAVFLIGSSEITEHIRSSQVMEEQSVTAMIEGGFVHGKYAIYSQTPDDFEHFLTKNVPVYLNQFSGVSASMTCAGLFGFRCRHTASYRDNFLQLREDLADYARGLYRVLILCPTQAECTALLRSLTDAEIPAVILGEGDVIDAETFLPGAVRVAAGVCRGGYDLPNPKIALLTTGEDNAAASRRRRTRAPKKKQSAGETILSAAELRPGDYVVHEVYGIGQFLGMEMLTIEGVTREYITIRYAGTDQLFIPADRLEMISKYIGAGAEEGTVRLSKMGSAEWQKVKSRAKSSAKVLAKNLIDLYARRQSLPGFAYPPDSDLETEFEDAFEFEETDPQLIAAREIKDDMMKEAPMDRLLCGDVGFGKTEVALRAAFKAICAGKQVAFLCPTTILALQHFQTALSRMRGFPVTVEMLSSFRSPSYQKTILRKLKRGDIDLLVGTHSLLSSRVEWRDLGLLIVDEEQRFGVAQKERLKEAASNIDVLTLTATPIPRTLNMAMTGIRDMSILDEAPVDRLPVQTYVMEHCDAVIFEAIRRELRRGGQTLYLHNQVGNIAVVAGKIAREIPEARVTWAHGQMEKDELEQIWQSLVRGEIDVLVCTTIIETGIDLPNANTLIIEDADRIGLAQLHQLRGRVGRSGRRAYAYFTFRPGKSLSDIATKRLEAIREYAEFGAGFRIAMRDLEIRGAGNLLGEEQHGNIDAVGYELYVRLLSEAVLEAQGKEPVLPFECKVDLHVNAYIPDTYIPSGAQRMDMYKKVSHIRTDEDRVDVLDEFCDRFGEPPAEIEKLLWVSLIRALGEKLHFPRVEQKENEVWFRCERLDLALWSELFIDTPALSVRSAGEAFIALRLRRGEDIPKTVGTILCRYAELFDRDKKEKAEGHHE